MTQSSDHCSLRYQVRVSWRFVLLSLLSSTLAAFAVGRTARIFLLISYSKELLELKKQPENDLIRDPQTLKLPNPVLKDGKLPPQTTYTSKNFDTAKSSKIISRWVVPEETSQQAHRKQPKYDNEACAASGSGTNSSNGEEVHYPVGQHLLMDIRNVDSSFLDSEERLARAMLDVVAECGLTLLSYHCHGLEPAGVTCVGVLLESHVSFHTWPSQGVITLDLFTCGPSSLLPIVGRVERLFGIPKEGRDPPDTVWAYKFRGFGADDEASKAELSDLFTFPIGTMTDFKKEVVSTRIKYDRVDIYDVLRPSFQSLQSYKKSLLNDDSYESRNPSVFEPDRIVFVNGILQSRRSGDSAYHESLVHPAMFAHENPSRIVVIGGSDGATLREVLKHNTVKKVFMIETDAMLTNITLEHFPEYHDCSFLVGGSRNCLDDPRVEIRYGATEEELNEWLDEKSIDLIILGDLESGFVKEMKDFNHLAVLFSHWISDKGVLVTSVGEAPSIKSPPQQHSKQKRMQLFIESLASVRFESVIDYEEGHAGFSNAWQFLVAFASFRTRAAWFTNEATVNLKLQKRGSPTTHHGSPFLFFDGPSQQSFMYPSRASEIVFCRQDKLPTSCQGGHGFDLEKPNISIKSPLEMRASDTSTHVFAKRDLPDLSFVGLDKLVSTVHFYASCYKIVSMMERNQEVGLYFSTKLRTYRDQLGHVSCSHGTTESYVDTTIQVFANDCCDALSYNFGYDSANDFEVATPAQRPLKLCKPRERIYDPSEERKPRLFLAGSHIRPVAHGEEILVVEQNRSSCESTAKVEF